MDKLKCHFPACSWMLLPCLSLSRSFFFFPYPFLFFWSGYKSQDVIGIGTKIKQHDLARFIPVPPRHPCWLREIKEGGGGSEGGWQQRGSPDNSTARMPVFEGFLFYPSLIYLIFVQGSQSALRTWGVTARKQLFLRSWHVKLLWELSDVVCQLMRVVSAWRSWENKGLDAWTLLTCLGLEGNLSLSSKLKTHGSGCAS